MREKWSVPKKLVREKVFSSLLAVLCTAVVRRVFRVSVRVVSQRSFVYLAARRTIDCGRNIVSIVVHPLSYWQFCARRWSAVYSAHLFVWLSTVIRVPHRSQDYWLRAEYCRHCRPSLSLSLSLFLAVAQCWCRGTVVYVVVNPIPV